MKGSILIGQSGGPTSVINASLAGCITAAISSEKIENVYGAINGIYGVLNHQIIDLRKEDLETIELLKNTPGSILGSVRYKLKDFKIDDTDYKKIKCVFESLNIKYFIYIGGNDSMDTCNKISKYFESINFDCNVMGVPKTVDNDLVETDHTPGYGSSIKYIANVIAEIYQDISCYKKGKVTIVEIMGRDAGWLTAGAKLASLVNNGADLIYLPESPFDMDEFLNKVNNIYKEKQHALIAISEGIKDKDGKYILEYRPTTSTDAFGHLQLGGAAQVLSEYVSSKLNLPNRSIELNLPQRCSSHIASLTDIDEAFNCGYYGVQYVLSNTDKMISMKRSAESYKIDYQITDLSKVANQVKRVPEEYITNNGSNISDDFIKYALPLINNEPSIKYKNGLQKFAKLKKEYIKL